MTECNCCEEPITPDADSVWVSFGPRDAVVFVCGKDPDCVGDELIQKENMIWVYGNLSVMFEGEQLFGTQEWMSEYLAQRKNQSSEEE